MCTLNRLSNLGLARGSYCIVSGDGRFIGQLGEPETARIRSCSPSLADRKQPSRMEGSRLKPRVVAKKRCFVTSDCLSFVACFRKINTVDNVDVVCLDKHIKSAL